MPDIRTYAPDQVKVIVGAHAITGAGPETFVAIEEVSEGVTSENGAYGDVARAMSTDRRHTVTLTLQQTSRSNDVLSSLYDVDRMTGGDGTFNLTVNDLRGGTLFAGIAWIVRRAPATFAAGLETKEWALEAVGTFKQGGNG